jgi:putative peptidoglycan lipid II flippase
VSVPAAAGLIVLRVPITRVLFERGEFEAAATVATAQALLFYALGLPAFSATRIAAQAFYALQDTRTPVKIGIAAVALNVLFALLFMGPLGHGGLALASSCSALANLAGLLWRLRREIGPLPSPPFVRTLTAVSWATGVMVGWCALILLWWPAAASRWTEAGWLLIAIGGSVASYAGVSAVLRVPEGRALVAVLWRRRGSA